MNLYKNVKTLCKEKGTPITQLEKELGFPQSSIRKWSVSEPGICKVKAVAEYLGVGIDTLVYGGCHDNSLH